MSKNRGSKKRNASPPPGTDMGDWCSQHDARSSSPSSQGSGGMYTRGTGKGTVIPPKPSPIRPRDRDRMFPCARDAGYSSAEVSHVSLGSAAHRHDPSHLRSENTVVSRSSSMRSKQGGGSPAPNKKLPLLPRPAKRTSPMFSYPSTPSSRGGGDADEDPDEDGNHDGGVSLRGGKSSSHVPPRQGASRARPLPHDFTHQSFKDLPSDSDGESSDGGVATSPRRSDKSKGKRSGSSGRGGGKESPNARHVGRPSPAEGPSPSRYHDGPPRDRDQHGDGPPPSLYSSAGASSVMSGSRLGDGLSQGSGSTLSPAAVWWGPGQGGGPRP